METLDLVQKLGGMPLSVILMFAIFSLWRQMLADRTEAKADRAKMEDRLISSLEKQNDVLKAVQANHDKE